MSQRMDYAQASPAALRAMAALERSAKELVPDKVLYELVKMRASQLNGCAYCLDMHTIDARAQGQTEQRIYLLSVWREAGALYTARERAALAWTEAVTLLADSGVPDDVYQLARQQFGEEELTNLTLLIVAINGWNRFGVGFRLQPGHYKPRAAQASATQ